jgi:hypothetical protein
VRRARELARVLTLLVLVVAGAAAGLKVLDWVARAAAPGPPRVYTSVAEVERAAGERLVLPSYFPDTLGWPPVSIRTEGRGRPRAVVLGFAPPDGGPVRLYVGQALGGAPAPGPDSLPPGVVLETHEATVGSARATLSRLLGEDGASWYELAWRSEGRAFTLRSRGSLAELVRMAESVHGRRR